ncbi:MAG: hypothetical protein AAGH90_05190 [Pseudomonadota bacterium]
MRSVAIAIVSIFALTGCATVSMAPATTMIVSATATQDQSDFRDSCSDFSTAIYERRLVTERNGVSQVFNMLAFGKAIETTDTAYRERVQIETAPATVVFKTVEADAKWASRHLNDITGSVSDLLTTASDGETDLNLRKDLVAFEEVLVLSKKVRVSFIDVMAEFEGETSAERDAADEAIIAYEASIDKASAYIERLSEAYADLNQNAPTS